MTIKEINISNFRCFKQFSLEFGPKATIIFGKNGTGKTTLIHALHKALSFIMYSDKIYAREIPAKNSKNGRRKRFLVDELTITSNNPYLTVEGFSRLGDYNNLDDKEISIKTRANLDDVEDFEWEMGAPASSARLRQSGFIKAFRIFYDWYKHYNSLPVLAYYSDCFPHKEDNKKATKKSKVAKLRNFGYFDWNAVEGCTKEWITRLEDNFFNISHANDLVNKLAKAEDNTANARIIRSKREEIERCTCENSAIEQCLKEFVNNLLLGNETTIDVVAIGIHSDKRNLCIFTSSGEEISFINLPSGYKRLFSIVIDLAYRSYILSEGQTANELPGIALIDEIDLHLHPELENVVMNRLMDVFKKIQFIVTTHSDNVLTGTRPDNGAVRIVKLLQLGYAPQSLPDIFGLDANSTLQDIMDVTVNGEELKGLIAQCAYMYSKDLREQADRLKAFIVGKKLISPDELQKRIDKEIKELR